MLSCLLTIDNFFTRLTGPTFCLSEIRQSTLKTTTTKKTGKKSIFTQLKIKLIESKQLARFVSYFLLSKKVARQQTAVSVEFPDLLLRG